jgi:hypothetical protein
MKTKHLMGLKTWMLLTLLGAPGTLFGAEKTWTDLDGRVIQGDFVSVDPAAGKVKLKLKNGTTPSVDLAKLCEADRTWIAEYQRKEKEALAVQLKNRGKVVSMKSEGPEAVGYHVYYPTSFDPAKPPAMIILFSPGGDGNGMLGAVQAACEDLGWIGVGCDEFRNGVSDTVLDPKWQEVLPAIEKAVPHNEDLLYLGGMSGGAERCYDYSEVTVRPWKGILAFGGWMGGKKALGCPPHMAIARVNGDKDQNARVWEEAETPLLKRARATLKSFTFPGGHEVAPPPVILDAMRWLKATTVPGKRLSSGKRHTAELDRDNGAGK